MDSRRYRQREPWFLIHKLAVRKLITPVPRVKDFAVYGVAVVLHDKQHLVFGGVLCTSGNKGMKSYFTRHFKRILTALTQHEADSRVGADDRKQQQRTFPIFFRFRGLFRASRIRSVLFYKGISGCQIL